MSAIILVNFDGTIADTFLAWSKWHDKYCGCCSLLQLSEPCEEDSRLRCRNRIFEFFYGPPNPYEEVKPIQDSINSIEYLITQGNDVWIVTESHPKVPNSVYMYKNFWIVNWMGEKWKNKFIVTPSKHIIRGDILIDDRTSVIDKWEKETKNIGLCLAQSWNEKAKNRFNSWNEIVSFLESQKNACGK